MPSLTFIELPPFTKDVYKYLTEASYQELQLYLASYPQAGDVIPGTGGCRKLRWAAKGHGKRGGARIIYYYRSARGQIWLLTLYAKNEEANLPSHYIRSLREEINDD